MSNTRQYIWCLIEFPNGDQKWYCISRVLREALLLEKKQNRFWKNTMIGNYLTISTSQYVRNQTRLTVGKVRKVSISNHKAYNYNWTRNQFVTEEHLMNFKSAYNYLKHDYSWYNRLSIWVALRYWHNLLLQNKVKRMKKKVNRIRGRIINYRNKKKF